MSDTPSQQSRTKVGFEATGAAELTDRAIEVLAEILLPLLTQDDKDDRDEQ